MKARQNCSMQLVPEVASGLSGRLLRRNASEQGELRKPQEKVGCAGGRDGAREECVGVKENQGLGHSPDAPYLSAV